MAITSDLEPLARQDNEPVAVMTPSQRTESGRSGYRIIGGALTPGQAHHAAAPNRVCGEKAAAGKVRPAGQPGAASGGPARRARSKSASAGPVITPTPLARRCSSAARRAGSRSGTNSPTPAAPMGGGTQPGAQATAPPRRQAFPTSSHRLPFHPLVCQYITCKGECIVGAPRYVPGLYRRGCLTASARTATGPGTAGLVEHGAAEASASPGSPGPVRRLAAYGPGRRDVTRTCRRPGGLAVLVAVTAVGLAACSGSPSSPQVASLGNSSGNSTGSSAITGAPRPRFRRATRPSCWTGGPPACAATAILVRPIRPLPPTS